MLNPALLAYMAQVSGAQPDDDQQQDPYAALGLTSPTDDEQPQPDTTVAPPLPDMTSVNDGINSVGRPSDDPAKQAREEADANRKARRAQSSAKGQALMALGAELMSAPTFGQGLSKGLLAYQQTINSLRPTTKTIGDGSYAAVTDPVTGEVTYRLTPLGAQKLKDKQNDRRKPQIAGDKVVQYGLDADGNYDGTVKDLTPKHLRPEKLSTPSGAQIMVFVDDDTGAVYDPKGTMLKPPTQQAPAAAPGGEGGFQAAVDTVLGHEGGYNAHDMNGAPVNFGINQKANPDVDVSKLTRDQAIQLYHDRYWVPSGAENLPPNMQAPYFDVYVRNPAHAKQFLAQSGGDPQKFMQLASGYFQSLAKKDGRPQYAKAWAARDADNLNTATAGTASAPAADAEAPAAAPDNEWGLQPHDFSATAAPAVRYLTPAEKKAAGYPADAVVMRDARGNDQVKEKGTAPGSVPSDDAIDNQAEIFRRTGKMPAMGLGNTTARNKIIERAAQLNKAEGLDPAMTAGAQAAYNADYKGFTTRTQQLSYMKSQVPTVIAHGNRALQLAAQVPYQTNVKLWNRVSQGLLDQDSNPTLYAMQQAAKQAEAEVAKVITGNPNSGAGQLTDEARAQFKIIEGPYGVAAKKKAWNTIVGMMEDKVSAVQAEQDAARQRLDGPLVNYVGSNKQPSAPKGGRRTIVRSGRTKDGRRVVQYSDGTLSYADQ